MHPNKFKTKLKKLNRLSETLPGYAYDLFVTEANDNYPNESEDFKFRVRLTLAFMHKQQLNQQDKAVISLALADYTTVLDALKTVEHFDAQKYSNTKTSYVFDSSVVTSMIGLYVIEKFIRPFELATYCEPMFSNNRINKIKSNIVKICESIKKNKGLDLIGTFDNFTDFADTVCISAISEVLGEDK